MPEFLGFLQASAGEDYGTQMVLDLTLIFSTFLVPIFIGSIWGAGRLTRGRQVEGSGERGDPGCLSVFFAMILLLIAFGIGTCYLSLIPLLLSWTL